MRNYFAFFVSLVDIGLKFQPYNREFMFRWLAENVILYMQSIYWHQTHNERSRHDKRKLENLNFQAELNNKRDRQKISFDLIVMGRIPDKLRV